MKEIKINDERNIDGLEKREIPKERLHLDSFAVDPDGKVFRVMTDRIEDGHFTENKPYETLVFKQEKKGTNFNDLDGEKYMTGEEAVRGHFLKAANWARIGGRTTEERENGNCEVYTRTLDRFKNVWTVVTKGDGKGFVTEASMITKENNAFSRFTADSDHTDTIEEAMASHSLILTRAKDNVLTKDLLALHARESGPSGFLKGIHELSMNKNEHANKAAVMERGAWHLAGDLSVTPNVMGDLLRASEDLVHGRPVRNLLPETEQFLRGHKKESYAIMKGLQNQIRESEIYKAETMEKAIPEEKKEEKSPGKEPPWKKSRNEFVEKLIADAEKNRRFPWESGYVEGVELQLQQSMRVSEINRKREEKNGKDAVLVNPYYQGGNQMRLAVASMEKGYLDPRWATFKQITELGGKVKKGEHGTLIEHWEVKKQKEWQLDDTGKKVPVMEKDEKTGEMKQKVTERFVGSSAYVFNYEQTENLPIAHSVPRRSLSEADRNLAMDNMVKNSEAKVYEDQVRRNFYSGSTDTIHVMPKDLFKSAEEYYGVVAHEIGHSTGAEKRLNREGITNPKGFGTDGYAREELVAELTSAFMQMKYGVTSKRAEENHEAYIQSWDRKIGYLKKHPDEFFRVVKDAEKATEYISARMVEKGLTKEEITRINGYSKEGTEEFRKADRDAKLAERKEKMATKKKTTTRKKSRFSVTVKKAAEKGYSR